MDRDRLKLTNIRLAGFKSIDSEGESIPIKNITKEVFV